ncbi:unnamed protein product [Cercospora beticola]|nr:unnamed protein product [Cercospora beticola]
MDVNGWDRDMQGLEAVNVESFPQALQPDGNRRGNSVRSPEPLMNGGDHSGEKCQAHDESSTRFYRDHEGGYTIVSPHENPSTLPSDQQKRAQKKICGLSRKPFVIGAVIVSTIILAAVFGGVLGTVLKGSSDSHNDNQPSEGTDQPSRNEYSPVDKTGTALVVPASGTSIFAYYSISNGLVEIEYKNGISSNESIITVVIARNAKPATPIAAIEVTPPESSLHRTVFYLDDDNLVNFVNTTLDGGWSEPYAIFTDLVAEDNTRALAAVAVSGDYEWRTGMRVYVGSSTGYITEVGYNYGGLEGANQWQKWREYEGSDPKAGVASIVVNEQNHLYMRNITTGALQQLLWDYTTDNTSWWLPGITSSSNGGVADGGSIAAASRGRGTDYVFYHAANGSAVGAFCSGTSCSDVVPGIQSLGKASVGYSLAATIADGTALVMNQDREESTNFLFSSVTRDGVSNSTTFTPIVG